MSRVIFLLEEPSMRVLLNELLPRLVPGLSFLCVSHEGKQDLEQSIPRKLRAWREHGVRFAVVRDNDSGDCHSLKARLVDLCAENGRGDTLIRIACQELEAWYIGQPEALAAAYSMPRINELLRKASYRAPDSVAQPAKRLAKLIPEFQKVSGARLMGELLSEENNRSPSFRAFISGARRLAEAIESPA